MDIYAYDEYTYTIHYKHTENYGNIIATFV